MKVVKQDKTQAPKSNNRRPPALDPKDRENQLIDLAVKRAEEQLLDGTASAQVITHFLKLATAKEGLERQKLEQEIEVLRAKVAKLSSETNSEELLKRAIKAMSTYQGRDDDGLDEDGTDDDGTDDGSYTY